MGHDDDTKDETSNHRLLPLTTETLQPPFTLAKLERVTPLDLADVTQPVSRVVVHSYNKAGSGVIVRPLRSYPSSFFISEPFSWVVNRRMNQLHVTGSPFISSQTGKIR